MPRHLMPRTVLAAGLAAATAAALAVAVRPATAVAAGQPAAGPAGPAAATLAAPAGPARQVLLINGDRLSVRALPGGGLAAGLLPGAPVPGPVVPGTAVPGTAVPGTAVPGTAGRGGLLSLKLAGIAYEFPADALPYLGKGLDPGLFRLSLLERMERGGRLPVLIGFAGRRPRLPGVKITRYGPGTATGYLTAVSARVFGAALARQFRADHARASYGTDGLFGGRVSIALAGTSAAPAHQPVRPGFQMHTLTVRATDQSGRPDTGDLVFVFNADNPAEFGDPIEAANFFDHGTTRFSVPAGHYWAIADFSVFTATSFSDRLDVLPQFAVTRNATVQMAERAASADITTTTARPAVPQQVTLELIRGGLHGTLSSFTWSEVGAPLWVSPTTRRPTVGTLLFYASAQLLSPASAAGIPYVYNADYAGPAGIIPADQHHVLRPASLADVSELYYQDVRTVGAFSNFGTFLPQLDGVLFAIDQPLRLPGREVQYFSAAPGLFWQSGYAEFSPSDFFPWGGLSDGGFEPLLPGPHTELWSRYPLHPQPPVSSAGSIGRALPTIPAAIRTGNTLNLAMTPFSDNTPGHLGTVIPVGPGATAAETYRVDQDGVLIAHGGAINGVPAIRLSPKPSRLRFTLNAALTGRFPLSTSSQTVWTWDSSRQPHAVLPPAWYCRVGEIHRQLRLLRGCAVQPLLTLDYQVRDESLTGLAPPGGQVISLHVGHIEPAGQAAATRAGAQVSYNDGQSWRRAQVTALGGGNFRIGFSAPAGVDVTLRVTASDSAGGSIRETILRAYGVRL